MISSSRSSGRVVQVPLVAVEEVEDRLERLIRDVDLAVLALDLVRVKQPAIEIGDVADQVVDVPGPRLRPAESVVEEAHQEIAVEGVEAVPADLLSDHVQAISQVVGVVVEEAAASG